MKSDSKITELSYIPGAPQMTLSSFLNLYQKCFCLVAILHDTQQSAIWQQNISRNPAAVHNISCHYRYNDTLFWCYFYMKNSVFLTSFIIHSFWCPKFENCVIMLYTKLASKIQMMIFNITAILKTIHTIDSGVNFTTRNLKQAKKYIFDLRLEVTLLKFPNSI